MSSQSVSALPAGSYRRGQFTCGPERRQYEFKVFDGAKVARDVITDRSFGDIWCGKPSAGASLDLWVFGQAKVKAKKSTAKGAAKEVKVKRKWYAVPEETNAFAKQHRFYFPTKEDLPAGRILHWEPNAVFSSLNWVSRAWLSDKREFLSTSNSAVWSDTLCLHRGEAEQSEWR